MLRFGVESRSNVNAPADNRAIEGPNGAGGPALYVGATCR